MPDIQLNKPRTALLIADFYAEFLGSLLRALSAQER
jgi:hypothetical protein